MPSFFPVLRKTTLVIMTLILVGCSGSRVAPETENRDHSLLVIERQGAMGALLADAVKAMEEGRQETAGHYLSRALRINPAEPGIYFYMARLRKEQGDHDQARQLAGRALSLGPSLVLKREIEALILSLKS